jgi:hypothetical protein
MCVEKTALHAQNTITTRISSKINIIEGGGGAVGEPIRPFDEHKKLHFDIE